MSLSGGGNQAAKKTCSSSHLQVVEIGFLIPLKNIQDEDVSISRIPVFEGFNAVGRNDLSVIDKRVSRKHISLNARIDGFVEMVVEGPNPVIINSRDQRKKICSQAKATIVHGDVLELIPGSFFFKYISSTFEKHPSSSTSNGSFSTEGKNVNKQDTFTLKRKRPVLDGEACLRSMQLETNVASCGKLEPIRHFGVDKDRFSLTFRLLQVKGLPSWANTSSVSIEDVIEGNVLVAVLSNYMVDMDWLLSACPSLRKISHVLVIHGESGDMSDYLKKNKLGNWIFHRPSLPISYGTHHSKAMLLVYPRGLRVVVHTANLIYVDWNNKSQGLWMQDFPWKDEKNPSKECPFENDLVDYLKALKWPEFSVCLPEIGNVNINASFFRRFDYSNAMVRLVASVPGYHTGSNLKRWGHMKLRSILQDCVFGKQFQNSPLVYQFSSLGSLDEKWMNELASSMSSGLSDDKLPLGLGKAMIIWPTVEDVRCSLEGYAAGNALPSPLKNVEKDFLKKYWARWKANHTGRSRAMPHIKSYTRYNGQNLAWFLLTSSNLSKAAWGALQKNNSQLMIRSYELGVLFLPSTLTDQNCEFSCTENVSSYMGKSGLSQNAEEHKARLVTLCAQGHERTDPLYELIPLPVPYELPPQPYTSEDVPWSWDRRYQKKDVYGQATPCSAVCQ